MLFVFVRFQCQFPEILRPLLHFPPKKTKVKRQQPIHFLASPFQIPNFYLIQFPSAVTDSNKHVLFPPCFDLFRLTRQKRSGKIYILRFPPHIYIAKGKKFANKRVRERWQRNVFISSCYTLQLHCYLSGRGARAHKKFNRDLYDYVR